MRKQILYGLPGGIEGPLLALHLTYIKSYAKIETD